MVLDAESDQRAECKPESDGEQVVNWTGAHSECSGLDVAKMISVDADGAKERREAANVDAPVVRAVRACVDGAGLALRAIEEVMGEDARMDHGKGSGLPAVARVGLAISVNSCDALNERESVGAVLADDVFIVFVFPTLHDGVGAVLVVSESPSLESLDRLCIVCHDRFESKKLGEYR